MAIWLQLFEPWFLLMNFLRTWISVYVMLGLGVIAASRWACRSGSWSFGVKRRMVRLSWLWRQCMRTCSSLLWQLVQVTQLWRIPREEALMREVWSVEALQKDLGVQVTASGLDRRLIPEERLFADVRGTEECKFK